MSSGNPLAPAEPSNWYAGSWLDGTTSIGYIAQCLAGPDGTVALTAGTAYDVWSQIQGTPGDTEEIRRYNRSVLDANYCRKVPRERW